MESISKKSIKYSVFISFSVLMVVLSLLGGCSDAKFLFNTKNLISEKTTEPNDPQQLTGKEATSEGKDDFTIKELSSTVDELRKLNLQLKEVIDSIDPHFQALLTSVFTILILILIIFIYEKFENLKKRKSLNDQEEDYNTHVNLYQQQNQELQNLTKELIKLISSQQQQNQELQNLTKELINSQLLTELKEKANSEKAKIQERQKIFENLEATVKQLTDQIQDLQTTKQTVGSEVHELETKIQEHQKIFGNLEATVKQLTDQIQDLQTTKQTVGSEVHELETKIQERQKIFGNLEATVKRLTDQIQDLQTTKQTVGSEVHELETKIQERQKIFENLEVQLRKQRQTDKTSESTEINLTTIEKQSYDNLVKQYNENPDSLLSLAIPVGITKDTLKVFDDPNQKITFERKGDKHSSLYWIINDYYLVLNPNANLALLEKDKINKNIFIHRKQSKAGARKKLVLIKPARVSLIYEGEKWELIKKEKGEIIF